MLEGNWRPVYTIREKNMQVYIAVNICNGVLFVDDDDDEIFVMRDEDDDKKS